jgi:hypothetical protein
MTACADLDTHRARVDGRRRHIPNWYELDWDHVSAARASWTAPSGVDLALDCSERVENNADRLRRVIATGRSDGGG